MKEGGFYVIAHLEFKEEVGWDTRKKILNDFEKTLYLKKGSTYNADWDRWDIDEAVWDGEITCEQVEELYEKWKDYCEVFDISVFYLREPDCYIYYTSEGG